MVDRGSQFLAAIAYPVVTAAAADAAVAALRSLPVFATATHRITAYIAGKAGYSDDDGEARAGGRLKSALKKRKVVDVACLVARWYGGVNIGKARFEHIAERATTLLEAVGQVPGRAMSEGVWDSAGPARTLSGAGGGGVGGTGIFSMNGSGSKEKVESSIGGGSGTGDGAGAAGPPVSGSAVGESGARSVVGSKIRGSIRGGGKKRAPQQSQSSSSPVSTLHGAREERRALALAAAERRMAVKAAQTSGSSSATPYRASNMSGGGCGGGAGAIAAGGGGGRIALQSGLKRRTGQPIQPSKDRARTLEPPSKKQKSDVVAPVVALDSTGSAGGAVSAVTPLPKLPKLPKQRPPDVIFVHASSSEEDDDDV